MTQITVNAKINKKGIGKNIGDRFSPWELRISAAGMDKNKGINSLIKPIKKKRCLWYFPRKRRPISTKKNNRKKQ
jgi:hypothetical protein